MVWQLGKRPALDGLRGVAILLVLVAHFSNPYSDLLDGAGAVGVSLFFTLSGFLITALLLEEHARTGRVSLRSFYRRRALRLMPALLTMVLVTLLAQALGRLMYVSGGMTLSALFSVSNLWAAGHGGFHNALGHTWSLGIEEQFYLAWPTLMLLSLRWGRRGVAWVGSVGMVVSVASIFMPGGDPWHGSVERGASLLAGCLLALWATGSHDRASRPWVAAAALAAMAPLVFHVSSTPGAVYALAVPALTVLAILGAGFGEGVAWLSVPVVRWFGRRSYGIYIWNYPALYALPLNQLPGSWVEQQATRLTATLLVAEASWWLIERPFMRRRSRDPGDPAQELVGNLVRRGRTERAVHESDVRRGDREREGRGAL